MATPKRDPVLEGAVDLAREAAARWQADYDRIAARFADQPSTTQPRTTHSGIPLKPAYFHHDVPAGAESEAPGSTTMRFTWKRSPFSMES